MGNTSDEKTTMRIRNRASYRLFQEIYDFLKSKPSTADIMRRFCDVLDSYNSFGSLQNAMYAAESLVQVREDNGIDIEQENKLQISERQ